MRRLYINMFLGLVISLSFLSLLFSSVDAEAATYSWDTGVALYTSYVIEQTVAIEVVGHNVSQGITLSLPSTVSPVWRSGQYYWVVNYTVPDDGCAWRIYAAFRYSGMQYFDGSYSSFGPLCSSYTTTVTTSGSFSGPSSKTATDAANSAAFWANQANSNAQTAATNAQNAYNAASSAASYAQTAANQTVYNGQSAAYWANQAYSYAMLAAQNAAPRIEKVQGLNGATCTTGSSFTVVISASPSSNVQYRVTCGSFDSGWTTSNQITISSGLVSGANTATVQVKNAVGNTAQASFTFFKL